MVAQYPINMINDHIKQRYLANYFCLLLEILINTEKNTILTKTLFNHSYRHDLF